MPMVLEKPFQMTSNTFLVLCRRKTHVRNEDHIFSKLFVYGTQLNKLQKLLISDAGRYVLKEL